MAQRSTLWVAAVCALLAGCNETLEPLIDVASLRVELVTPADPGSSEMSLPDEARDVTVRISAIDTRGEVATDFNRDVDVYSHFLGSITPERGGFDVLARVTLVDGESGEVQVSLPRVFGPTFLWVEDARGEGATFVTGTSPTLFFRRPYLEDISRPVDESRLDALEASPLEEKQVVVTQSRHGARGRLVATGIYSQGYTLSDVECGDENGTPPCTVGDYDSILVFTFGRPEGQEGRDIRVGTVITQMQGAVVEFNGLTEIGFPSQRIEETPADPSLVPDPVVIDPDWLVSRIELERVESSLVAIDGATVCPLDEDFETFGQWKLDVGRGCRDAFNIITQGQVSEFDPEQWVGATLPRVVGTLRPINIGSFDVWLVYPRSIADIELP